MTWADVVAFAEAHQPGARAIECPRCRAAPYVQCQPVVGGLITPNGETTAFGAIFGGKKPENKRTKASQENVDRAALMRIAFAEAGIPIEWWDEPPEVEPARAAGAGK